MSLPAETNVNGQIVAEPAEIQWLDAAATDGAAPRLRRFQMTAYTGGPMQLSGWRYPVVVDLAGLQASSKPKVFLEHDRTQRVGHIDQVQASESALVVAGNGNVTHYQVAVDAQTQQVRAGNQSITIHRDASGRIDWISTNEAGGDTRISYSYLNGELVAVTDVLGKTTHFTYQTQQGVHRLKTVTDARNVTVITVEYDAAGKVQALKDLRNQTSSVHVGGFNGQVTHNSTTDVAGQIAEQVTNDRGDVVREIRAFKNNLGAITKYVVTVYDYQYFGAPNSFEMRDLVRYGQSSMNRLHSHSTYESFTILGTDPTGQRYTSLPHFAGHHHYHATEVRSLSLVHAHSVA